MVTNNTDGKNCQVCGKLSGIPGMGFCFSCSASGPEWAQHESIAWLEHDLAKWFKRDIDSRNAVEKQLNKKKPNKLKVDYY
jgi:hypothetical protein